MANSFFKTGSKWVLGMALAAGVAWWLLPLSVTHYHDVVRGEELINNIKQYNIQNNKLPESRDWASLKQIGFLQNEIAQSYPRYTKINNTTYALDFVSDFDGPYLFWNSKEQQWKVSQRAYPGY